MQAGGGSRRARTLMRRSSSGFAISVVVCSSVGLARKLVARETISREHKLSGTPQRRDVTSTFGAVEHAHLETADNCRRKKNAAHNAWISRVLSLAPPCIPPSSALASQKPGLREGDNQGRISRDIWIYSPPPAPPNTLRGTRSVVSPPRPPHKATGDGCRAPTVKVRRRSASRRQVGPPPAGTGGG